MRLLFAAWLVVAGVLVARTVAWPWAEGEAALAREAPGPRLLVAFSLTASFSRPARETRRAEAYLVWPASFRSLAAYEVLREDGAVRVQPIPVGLPVFALVHVVWAATAFWYGWIRRETPAA